VARLIPFAFDVQHRYDESAAGILVPIALVRDGDHAVELKARLDTGASDCLFDVQYAGLLGIEDVQSGMERTFRTVVGPFRAFGHELTVLTLGFQWSAMVFFYQSGNPANAFLGRRGWLDRVRLGIIHYEQSLYLDQYGS
jgi:hypothetical protein